VVIINEVFSYKWLIRWNSKAPLVEACAKRIGQGLAGTFGLQMKWEMIQKTEDDLATTPDEIVSEAIFWVLVQHHV
jgi:hypothetical protein